MNATNGFKLTYSTMFDPPAELHQRFDQSLARIKSLLGREYAMLIGGRERSSKDKFEVRSPIDRDWLLGVFQQGSADDVDAAVAAARAAYLAWAATPWQERVRLLRGAAHLIEERVYDIGAAVALEVGKNRMESLGEVQETADLIAWYCTRMEENQGFAQRRGNRPLHDKGNWMGPVINASARARYQKCVDNLGSHGQVLTSGRQLVEGELARGYFCAPTVATAALDYRLWREEKFVPIVLVGEVESVDAAIAHANASEYGLTAGFYGGADEIEGFFAGIEAGVTYANRPQGATTGAWPGYQPFGGWKASGSTGKAIGSFYYLQQYMREQSQTVVD